MKAAAANKPTPQNAGPASVKTASATPAKNEESDDEEEGRAAMVGKKRKAGPAHAKKTTVAGNVQTSDKVDGDESVPTKEAPSNPPSKGRRKATSYLDELLAERSKKRKKR